MIPIKSGRKIQRTIRDQYLSRPAQAHTAVCPVEINHAARTQRCIAVLTEILLHRTIAAVDLRLHCSGGVAHITDVIDRAELILANIFSRVKR